MGLAEDCGGLGGGVHLARGELEDGQTGDMAPAVDSRNANMLTVGEILQDSLQRSGGVDDVWEELQQRCCLRRGSPPFTTSHRSNVWHRLYEAPLIRQGTRSITPLPGICHRESHAMHSVSNTEQQEAKLQVLRPIPRLCYMVTMRCTSRLARILEWQET